MSLQHLPTAVPEYPKVNTRMTMLQSLMVSAFTGLAFHVPRASSRGLSRGNVSSQAKKNTSYTPPVQRLAKSLQQSLWLKESEKYLI